MLLPNGEIFGGLACTNSEENISILPAGPVGATQPPLSANSRTFSLSKVHKG